MSPLTIAEIILAILLVIATFTMILVRKPVHSCLAFLTILVILACQYLILSSQFISVMQVIVYAGAILVIFMFVIVLFQDAHDQVALYKSKSFRPLIYGSVIAFILTFLLLGSQLSDLAANRNDVPPEFGSVISLGQELYINFFFPFEAVILLFLVALIGSFYVGKKNDYMVP